ncbi:hypothetical protein PV04_02932 [Phialophora macrospora]|uniref:Uncharacterized protein n=1 Tax=Phialophora macrospora TaxID=1851006 RepID=A0A0D2E8P9_9EURO|nr:hypothetical protein PV04_02932 [Phialophora macrospora]
MNTNVSPDRIQCPKEHVRSLSIRFTMKFTDILASVTATVLSLSLATAQTIGQINGNRFISPYRNQNVYNVTGLVTATGRNRLRIRSTRPDLDIRTSKSIYVFGRISSTNNLTVTTGDVIVVDGLVSEYRSNPAYLYLTEMTRPTNIRYRAATRSAPSCWANRTPGRLRSNTRRSTMAMCLPCQTTRARSRPPTPCFNHGRMASTFGRA